MKPLLNILKKEPKYINIYYHHAKDKLVCHQHRCNAFIELSDGYPDEKDENLSLLFTITPYMLGAIKSLKISFAEAKRRILTALFKDLSNPSPKSCIYDKNSNLYNVLVNEFGIKLSRT